MECLESHSEGTLAEMHIGSAYVLKYKLKKYLQFIIISVILHIEQIALQRKNFSLHIF